MRAHLLSEDEVKPFSVFISSSQTEFGKLRENLKERINSEPFVNQQIMSGVLIEHKRGEMIAKDIQTEIEKCSIYVGIFGRKESVWTFAEYRAARARGLPVLIYQFSRRKKPGRPRKTERRGRKSEVQKFLEKEVKSQGIRIRGPYRNEGRLEEDILRDLTSQMIEMIEEASEVRRTIHKGLFLA